MATSSIGSLIVSVETNLAQFTGDMGKMAASAESHMRTVSKAAAAAKRSLDEIVGAVSIVALAHYAGSLIETVAHLQDLHKQTGLTVEALSAVSVVAASSGVSVDEAAGAFNRLQKSVYAAQKGTGDAAQMFHTLGLTSKDLAAGLRNPDQMLLQVAKALDQFYDDGTKDVYMTTLLGKSGAQMAEFLHQIAVEGFGAANVMADQAQKAHELEEAYTRLKSSLTGTAANTLVYWLPSIERISAGLTYIGVAMVASFKETWADIKFESLKTWYSIIDSMQTYGNTFANWWRRVMSAAGYAMPQVKLDQTEGAKNMQAAIDDYRTVIDLNEKAKKGAQFDWYMANHPDVPRSADTGPDNRKHLPPTPAKYESDVGPMRRALDAQVKEYNDAAKKIEEIWQTHDNILDRQYKQGELSLAEYGDTKLALMDSSFAAVQAVYDGEITAIEAYITKMDSELARAKQAFAPKATIDKILAQIDEANSKLNTARGDKAAAANDQLKAQEAYYKDNTAASNEYADTLVKLDEQYYAMIGDTEALANLQTEWDDRMQRSILTANQDAAGLARLKKIEDDIILRGKQDWFSGVKVGLADWTKQANNIAAGTKNIVTSFLDGMTDALVNFVQTGKLNFRSLINDMIAQIARLIIQQEEAKAAGAILSWLTAGVSGSSAALGTGEGSYSDLMASGGSGFSGPRAAGGPVAAGSTYLVGEKGPEFFTPDVSGSITANGAGMAPVVMHYAPNITIDSRSDRAQVQADVARVVRQGNKEFALMLQRYNPGIRM